MQLNRLAISIDRARPRGIAEEIAVAIRTAVADGSLAAGTRLPSWTDLATQLGVSRGTVRRAYELLVQRGIAEAQGAAGTRIRPAAFDMRRTTVALTPPSQNLVPAFERSALAFQMGVPAADVFPAKLWARVLAVASRDVVHDVSIHPDPRGDPQLRAAIAAHLAVSRGLRCLPDQILVTTGYRSGVTLALETVGLRGATAWVEDPCFPVTARALRRAGLELCALPVDGEGLCVEAGIEAAPDARLVAVTPGQQAPTGVALSERRRRLLLEWAQQAGAWVIEDDYLSEMQMSGRAMPALATGAETDRVFHCGTFSKTLGSVIGLGFVVAPLTLAERMAETAAAMMPAPCPIAQRGLARFIEGGHFMRHLRRMKAVYASRRGRLVAGLEAAGYPASGSGVAALVWLKEGTDDVALMGAARERGLSPAPLSPWFVDGARRRPGLLLSSANHEGRAEVEALPALLALMDAARP